MIFQATRPPQPSLKLAAQKLSILILIDLLILAAIDLSAWLRRNGPRFQVYALTRYDLIKRRVTWPPAQWVAVSFVGFVFLFWWLDIVYNAGLAVISRGGIEICLA